MPTKEPLHSLAMKDNELLPTRQPGHTSHANSTRFACRRCGSSVCIDHFRFFCLNGWEVNVYTQCVSRK